jgi:hypothetical protein
MEDFERQLKKALTRKDPSPWFEAKVMAAAERQSRERAGRWRRIYAGRARGLLAVLAAVLLIVGIAWRHQQRVQERIKGEAAKAQLELALKITGAQLQKIGQHLETARRAD